MTAQTLEQFGSTKFNPNDHMMDLKGKKYLPVAARIAWAQAEFPKGFSVEILAQNIQSWQEEDPRNKGKTRTVREAHTRVRITFGNGNFYDGSKSETTTDFGDFIEKSETGAIGRALALAGYGTLFAPEFDESATTSRAAGIDGVRIVDTPQALRDTEVTAAAAVPTTNKPPARRSKPADLAPIPAPWEEPASPTQTPSASGNSTASAPSSQPSLPASKPDDLVGLDNTALRTVLMGIMASIKDGSGEPKAPYTDVTLTQVNATIAAANQAHKVARAGDLPTDALANLVRSVREIAEMTRTGNAA